MSKETLEEVAENYGWRVKRNTFSDPVKANDLANSAKQDFIEGAKWQEQRMYSEEEVLDMLPKFAAYTLINADERSRLPLDKWFEQFKKK